MSLELHNTSLRLTIETAGETYTGSRFDWNGTIVELHYKSLSVLSQEKLPFHRNPHIYGRGLQNEFGIKDCIGYDEIPAGAFFPKIGTGWLVKDEHPYSFCTQYRLKPLQFSYVKEGTGKAVFTCISGEENGYSYTYTKTIELADDSFIINYDIRNTGAKQLSTTEYVHNFLNPGKHGTGPHLALEFPWMFAPERLIENVSTEGIIRFEGNTLKITNVPRREFFIGGTWQAREHPESPAYCTQKARWTLTDAKDTFRMSESCSFVPCGADVWGHRSDISPELFIRIDIAPGSSCRWSRTYSFEQAPAIRIST